MVVPIAFCQVNHLHVKKQREKRHYKKSELVYNHLQTMKDLLAVLQAQVIRAHHLDKHLELEVLSALITLLLLLIKAEGTVLILHQMEMLIMQFRLNY